MNLNIFIERMPKAELHVHLKGATQPETVLKLAARNGISLPVQTVDEMRAWCTFRDFDHFIEVYDQICECVCTGDDVELLMREFIAAQAAQNILYTEVTYTPTRRFSFDEQITAIGRARQWGHETHGIIVNIVIDMPREDVTHDESLVFADWAISGMVHGVVALGLGGPEAGHPPEKFADAFARARAAGLPGVPHAGETVGAESICGALDALHAVRIGHGVRCLEDHALVAELRERQIPLEVCPTSNICLGVAPSLADHPLSQLLDAGLYVTINSDDPPMFDTTLTQEYQRCAKTFGFDAGDIEGLVMNAVWAALLPPDEKAQLEARFEREFARLRGEFMTTE